jgi:capsular exopolysaccharide synthesis family protein
MNLFLGLFGGLVTGIGLAFFVDYLDNRVKNPDEIRQFLGLGFLGLVPGLRDRDLVDGQSPLISGTVAPMFAEAIREIRTSVMFSSAEEGPRSLVVTSTQPGEGKSVVAANLAISLSHAGQRVLLVDADMRKPRLHELLMVKRDPGLSSLLVGQANAADVGQKGGTNYLWVMAAGPAPPNPAELLGSMRFVHLLKDMGDHFDWVVLDSPPMMAVTDPAVIAHRATGVVFVVGSEQVNRHKALTAVQKLLGSKAKILGAVLNRADIQRNPYYYANYHSHDYADYYASEKKTERATGSPFDPSTGSGSPRAASRDDSRADGSLAQGENDPAATWDAVAAGAWSPVDSSAIPQAQGRSSQRRKTPGSGSPRARSKSNSREQSN